MKKSNKGFTLVELLAAIVIMGILILFAAPAIINMVSNNRDRMYIVDAEKLIALAENKMNAASSTMEKPDPGKVIIISMNYLSNEEFDVAPNRGEYVTDASYVVVRNKNNGELEYSVAIMENLSPKEEERSSTYRGVQLVTSNKLKEKNAPTKLVKTINYRELKRIDSKDSINSKYIEGQTNWKNVVISNIYNIKELPEDAIQLGSEPPTIVKSVMASTSGKKYNSLDATLSLIAEDEDNDISKLSVYISTESYEDANKEENKTKYGDELIFTKDFDFSKNYDYKDGGSVKLYIIVKDPDGNKAQVTYTYDIHRNEPPAINLDDSGLNKIEDERFKAALRVSVDDDIDKEEDLNVCITTDVNAKTCTDYKKFSEEFSGIEKNYDFSNRKCINTPQTISFKVFIRDQFGAETSEVLGSYQINPNSPPKIGSVNIESVSEVFTDARSLNTKIQVDASDDFTSKENLRLLITNGEEKHDEKYDPDSPVDFRLDGKYDGKSRKVTITIEDECGATDTKYYETYEVYRNQPPTIENLKIESHGDVCNNLELCPPQDGGSVDSIISFDVKDDIDAENLEKNISICLTENINDCQKEESFKPYSDYAEGFEYKFDKGKDRPYDGKTSNKTIYVVARDSEKEKSMPISSTYKLYANKPPVIITKMSVGEKEDDGEGEDEDLKQESLPRITSASDDGHNFSLAKYELEAIDDLDENLLVNICYRLEGSTEEKCFGEKHYQDIYTIDFKETNYAGQKYLVYALVKDSYGEISRTEDVTYELYKDAAPEIDSVVARIDGGIPKIELTDDSTDKEKRACTIDIDEDSNIKYYDREGTETTEANYKKKCLSCFQGTEVTEDGQEVPIFYNKNGDIVEKEVHDEECGSYVTNSPPPAGVDNLKVSFIVKDLYDTYSVCVSKNPDTCTNYVKQADGKEFDGTSEKSNMVYFVDKSGIEYYNKSMTSVDNYYLFVKDSRGNTAVVKTTNEEGQEITSNSYYFTATKEDTMCKDIENSPFQIEYTKTSTEEITPKECGGQCYYVTKEDTDEQKTEAENE